MSIRILHVEIGRPARENKSVERAAAQSILENLALTSIQSRLKQMKVLQSDERRYEHPSTVDA